MRSFTFQIRGEKKTGRFHAMGLTAFDLCSAPRLAHGASVALARAADARAQPVALEEEGSGEGREMSSQFLAKFCCFWRGVCQLSASCQP
jgi:hypothetical protein